MKRSKTHYFAGIRCILTSMSAEKPFTKALHLSDPWEVFSVNIDDTDTEVDQYPFQDEQLCD